MDSVRAGMKPASLQAWLYLYGSPLKANQQKHYFGRRKAYFKVDMVIKFKVSIHRGIYF